MVNKKSLLILIASFLICLPGFCQDYKSLQSDKVNGLKDSIATIHSSYVQQLSGDSLQQEYFDFNADTLQRLQNKLLQKKDTLPNTIKLYKDSVFKATSRKKNVVLDSLQQLEQKVGNSIITDELNEHDLPKMGAIDNELQKLEVPKEFTEITTDMPTTDIPELPEKEIPTFDIEDQLNDNLPLEEIKGIQSEVEGIKSIRENPDAYIDQQAGKLEELQEFSKLSKETEGNFGELTQQPELPTDFDFEKMKEEGSMQAAQQLNELFQTQADKIQEAQNLMQKLKKKYKYVGNSSDMSTAVKANSLKGEPLKKRLVLGGNFNFNQGNPFALDLAPMLMYKINRDFYTGISVGGRISFGIDSSSAKTNASDAVGASWITQHKIFKGFFGHAELEYRSTKSYSDPSATTTDEFLRRTWVPGALLGIGKRLNLVGKLQGTVIFTYDFLHNDKSLSEKAWNFKFGLNLNDLDIKKKPKGPEQ